MHNNPWKLTPKEYEVMRCYVEGGSFKAGAATIGLNEKTFQTHMYRAKLKMGIRSTIHALLAFDRWARQQEAVHG